MNIRLTKNRVLLLRLPKATQSPGGIHFPMQFNDDEKVWWVGGVSPKVTEIALGDRVLVDFTSGFTVLPDDSRLVDASQLLMKW
jgi:co-chaperonin GroES (HSP10)